MLRNNVIWVQVEKLVGIKVFRTGMVVKYELSIRPYRFMNSRGVLVLERLTLLGG
jgi:hypothetical protein